jgi:hypothetical protein
MEMVAPADVAVMVCVSVMLLAVAGSWADQRVPFMLAFTVAPRNRTATLAPAGHIPQT